MLVLLIIFLKATPPTFISTLSLHDALPIYLGGDRVGRFRAVDHPPGNDDLLVVGGGPLEIGHRDLAVRTGLQRLQKLDRKSTRLNSSHSSISYAVFCLKKKKNCIHSYTSH